MAALLLVAALIAMRRMLSLGRHIVDSASCGSGMLMMSLRSGGMLLLGRDHISCSLLQELMMLHLRIELLLPITLRLLLLVPILLLPVTLRLLLLVPILLLLPVTLRLLLLISRLLLMRLLITSRLDHLRVLLLSLMR